MTAYQGIVLSGGGSKGPYALGVLLALRKYRQVRDLKVSLFYCGTSVGALNATLAAQGDLDNLSNLYASLHTKEIIGRKKSTVSKLKIGWLANESPFSYFSNEALAKTIKKYARFDALEGGHLLVCATNFLSGTLETFYVSALLDEFISHDQNQPMESRRLRQYHRISNQEQLVEALLASAAIPFFFPPITINNELYVDGGIGNNTALRQAAYFCRYLSRVKSIVAEPTICILNDPRRNRIANTPDSLKVFSLIQRTIDIFQNELVRDSLLAWERINHEVSFADEKIAELSAIIDATNGLSLTTVQHLKNEVARVVRQTNAVAPRLKLKVVQVRPSSELEVKDILTFDPLVAVRLKRQGIEDCLKELHALNEITSQELGNWPNEIN